jgi:hypothetical protein
LRTTGGQQQGVTDDSAQSGEHGSRLSRSTLAGDHGKNIAFFERKVLTRLKEDYHGAVRYAGFIEFCQREGTLASLMTPARHGKEGENAVWDAWRVCGFAEIPGFYGLCYRYVYQVSVLGIGPIWMSGNQDAQARAKRLLADGNIFAFGLSEREHGADIYASDMIVTPAGGRRLLRVGRQVLHRQCQQGGNGSGLRQDGRWRRIHLLRRRFAAPELPADQEHGTWPELRRRVPPRQLPAHRGRRPAQGRRRLERGAQHDQYRQVQPRLGFGRHAPTPSTRPSTMPRIAACTG